MSASRMQRQFKVASNLYGKSARNTRLYLCLGTIWSPKSHQGPLLCDKHGIESLSIYKPEVKATQCSEAVLWTNAASKASRKGCTPAPMLSRSCITPQKIFLPIPLLQAKYCYQHRQLWNTVCLLKTKQKHNCLGFKQHNKWSRL